MKSALESSGMDRDRPVRHEGLALLEVADPLLLDELLRDPRIALKLGERLSPNACVLLPANLEAVQLRLKQLGQPPRVIR